MKQLPVKSQTEKPELVIRISIANEHPLHNNEGNRSQTFEVTKL